MSAQKTPSQLVLASAVFDEQLHQFEALVARAERVNLNSQRNIEKAAAALGEAAQCQALLPQLMQTFVTALDAAREHNQKSATLLEEVAQQIRARGDVLTALRERMTTIAAEGAAISATVKDVTAEPNRRRGEVVPELREIETRLSACIEQTAQLHDDAKSADFADVAGDVEAIRQQLQAARNKVKLLREQLEMTAS